jgi:hypothetical protein
VARHSKRRLPCRSITIPTRCRAFERTSKRRKGFPSETRVKRGVRSVKGGAIELLEKLGRNDPCPCGSGKRFQDVLPEVGPVSTGPSGGITGGELEHAATRVAMLATLPPVAQDGGFLEGGQPMGFTRATAFVLMALALCGATDPPPPPELAAYVEDGRFEPGDHGWARGAFAGATPEEVTAYRKATDWAAGCRKAARDEAVVELAAMGIDAPDLEENYFALTHCPVVLPRFDLTRPFAEFEAALREARPVAETYIAAARLAQQRALGNAGSYGEALTARTLEEQMLRLAMNWGREPLTDVPRLSADAEQALQGLLTAATSRSDAANTEWLKARVAEDGWPTISAVGEKGAMAAWLLTQHADADPVFQARALRLMEPLLAQGEVSRQNYAYLYDRIMLKLTGKQRYGSQWGACEGSVRPLRPLEDKARLAELRAEMGMPTIEEYGQMMDRMSGACGEK